MHFIREKVLSDQLHVCFILGCDQVADVLRKLLMVGAFSYCRRHHHMNIVAAGVLCQDATGEILE